jgi:hypothetical protein
MNESMKKNQETLDKYNDEREMNRKALLAEKLDQQFR